MASVLPTKWEEVCASKAMIMGLKRYSFRREYSAHRLAAAGFSNIELVDSFDGFEGGDIDEALKELGIQCNSELGKGHKGCVYTHMRAWKQMIDDGVPYRIFFEDDALGHLDLPRGLGQRFWDATPKDFHILYMGNMISMNNPALNHPDKIVVKSITYCLHAYMLTLEGAKHLWRLAQEWNSNGYPLNAIDIQLVFWQNDNKLKWYCWNGTWTQKSFPTFDEGLPWQAFPDVITPVKDTGLFWQNMRLGTTLAYPTLQLAIRQYTH